MQAKGAADGEAPVPPVMLKHIPDAVLKRKLTYKQLPTRALVTGGNGFVGRAIVELLLDQACDVTVFDITLGKHDPRVKRLVGNLGSKTDLAEAVRGIDVIYHVAAPHATQPRQVQYAVNVKGTENLLEAAKQAGVKKLVFTSSASVVYDGNDQCGVDETTPIPTFGLDAYTTTKAMAEELVLQANGQGGLLTAAIRPNCIFGPGDRQFFPVLIKQARRGRMKYGLGDGKNVADFVFVKNVAHAHLLAAEKLNEESDVAGQAFFVTNDTPVRLWDFISSVLTGFGYSAPSVWLPAGFVNAMGGMADALASGLGTMGIKFQPAFTQSRMRYMTTHHYYNIDKAKRLLGYAPAWTLSEALDISLQSMMAELRNSKAAAKTPVVALHASRTALVPRFTKKGLGGRGKRAAPGSSWTARWAMERGGGAW